ncbi:AAA domain (dynein-related subfamily) [Legionella busanensis]|uniref:AAA domain (Dynein-related subfamily) n=1 Tax=Legionella busanensis TaxID=190655 RepID=A0A378JHU2_9GAMM|nr:hypothetical protein [Legionella busanensis]STX50876.1 AAA domain (dynein-related subfamily) [Legionella busanensis]
MPDLDPFFYLLQTVSKRVYQETPTGNIEVNELIKQKPYWIPASLPKKQQPKKIILADWSARNWSEDKISAVIEELTKLIDAGFSVSIWQAGQLTPLTKDNLTILRDKRIRTAMIPAYPDEIRAPNKHYNQDNSLILDDYWVSYLVENKPTLTEGRGLKISDYLSLTESEQAKVIAILQQATPPFTYLIHDIFSSEANTACKQFQEKFPFIPIKTKYESISFLNFEQEEVIKNFILHGIPIVLEGFTLTQEDLKTLTYFNSNLTIQPLVLQSLFKIAPKLRTLQIKLDSQDINLEKESLSNLQEIYFAGINFVNLQKFILAASNLRSLNLNHAFVLQERLNIDLKNLISLEELTLSCAFNGEGFYRENINLLIAAASQLKKISIESYTPESITTLSHLEHLSVSYSAISQDLLQKIFSACPIRIFQASHMKEINLSNEEIELNTQNVEEVELSDCKFSASTINSLLKAAFKLRKLSIRNSKNDIHLQLEKGSLSHLTEVEFSNTSMSADNLSILLLAAPNLTSLSIERNLLLDIPLKIDLQATKLEEIIAIKSNISIANLQVILRASPKLKKLSLAQCTNLNEALNLTQGSLPDLEHLTLDGSNINKSSLDALLLASPKLREISLIRCSELSGDWKLSQQNLANLEIFKANGTRINISTVQSILTKAIKIKELSLSECQNLTGELALPKQSLLYLEKIDLSYNTCTSFNLEILLKAAPQVKTLILGPLSHPSNLNLPIQSLKSLEEVQLATESNHAIQALLTAAPNLKIVNFCKSVASLNDLALEEKSLKQLEVLNLKYSHISILGLKGLLKAAPNLISLDLESCPALHGQLNLPINSLSKLQDLNLGSSSLNPDGLVSILRAAPKIVNLDFRHCQPLMGQIKIPERSLLYLETINLINTKITPNDLKALLLAAPNLKTINLNNCSIDYKQIKQDAQLKQLLEKIQVIGINLDVVPKDEKADKSANKDENINRNRNSRDAIITLPNLEDSSLDRPFNPTEQRNFVPTPDEFEFHYRGLHKTKNQGMIIEKLSQYLTLKGQHLATISKMQDGICNALTHLFQERDHNEWNTFIDTIANWDGTQENVNPSLQKYFDELHGFVKNYQLNPKKVDQQYLGDNLADFLKLRLPAILNNAWHAIAIQPLPSGKWLVYDPNFTLGAREVENHRLIETIHMALGNLVGVEAPSVKIKPKVKDPAIFLEEGGLLILSNYNNRTEILSQLTPLKNLSIAALEGILLRNNEGIPAWVIGLKNPELQGFTHLLLQQFMEKNSENTATLRDSIAHLSEFQRHEILTYLPLIKPFKINTKPINRTAKKEKIINLADLVHDPNLLLKGYEKAFTTWRPTKAIADNLLSYTQSCIQPLAENKKRLIKVNDTKEVTAVIYALESHCQSKRRPVFRVDSPDDLICSSPFISYDSGNNTGQLKKGPGGRLYDFLTTHKGESPVILVNYDRFSASDLVRFNTLLDEKRQADGTLLPEDTLVIGVINTKKPDCYQGSDFYSRFKIIENCPIAHEPLVKVVPNLSIPKAIFKEYPSSDNPTIINLYHAADWETQLLGQWTLSGDQLTFKEGKLAKAIDSGKHIQLHNAPWHDESFVRFWQDAYFRGSIQTPGPSIKFPQEITLAKHEGYEWGTLEKFITLHPGLSKETQTVLNPTSYGDFLSRYTVVGQGIKLIPGIIEENKGSTLDINVTRSLSQHEWARLINTCQVHGVKLAVHCAPGVALPSELGSTQLVESSSSSLNKWTGELSQTQVLVSSELDTTIAQITQNGSWEVIDVSECKPSDLLYRLHGKFKEKELRFEFSGENKALLQALALKKKVLLKGEFSVELQDALAPLLLQRLNNNSSDGQLVLITSKADNFHFANPQQHHVSVKDKQSQLNVDEAAVSQLAPYLEHESLSQLKARTRHLTQHPKSNSDEAWQGIYDLPINFRELPNFNPESSQAEAEKFSKARRNQILKILKHSPFVFLTGLSGVGKSTFVENELLEKDEGKLYIGETNITDWATSSVLGKKILFLDEANLSQKQFSEFEGLFNKPPTILIDGVMHTLTDKHQVIFAGNPLSYGDERQLAPFFKRHGNTVVFNPLPPAVLYEKILKPVFENTPLSAQQQTINKHILESYRFLCAYSTNDILITPRELQMMALLVVAQYNKNPTINIESLTKQIISEIARPLVPTNHLENFDKQYIPAPSPPVTNIQTLRAGKKEFFITSSRHALTKQLNDLLDLCELRDSKKENFNVIQRFGGLGGIIIEGDPGIGKSDLLQALFAARGYEQAQLKDENPKDKPFYIIPISMSINEKEKLLLRAFDEGAKVILEEVNSSPMMEKLLNSLLMGKTPEGNLPKKPGFMIFGTQNPTSMAGRRAASTALSRRLITTILTPYPTSEMIAILVHKGLPKTRAEVMVKAFENQLAYAQQHHLSPPPNFRNLIHLAELEIEHLSPSKALEFSSQVETAKNSDAIQNIQQNQSLASNTLAGIHNPQAFLIQVVNNYIKSRENQNEVILPFQFTKKEKLQAARQLITALENTSTFISSKDRKALIQGSLCEAIQNVLTSEICQTKFQGQLQAKKPINSVNELIDFLNQQNPKETLRHLLKDYVSQYESGQKTSTISFFNQKTTSISLARKLITKLQSGDLFEISGVDYLMQGALGSQIKELMKNYEKINGIKINDLKQLINICQAPIQSESQALDIF